MEVQKFVKLREYLYHLTDESNLSPILAAGVLSSAEVLARLAGVPNVDQFLRTRRLGHCPLNNGKLKAILRDQDPLFKNIIIKNLEGGWTFEDFVYSLNSRVFLWATEKDLNTHYKRYENQGEYPKILRFRTAELFSANKQEPQFCRFNSGAPRCSSFYEEGAAPRGPRTFLKASDYETTPSSVREITFVKSCILPDDIWISNHPNNPYRKV